MRLVIAIAFIVTLLPPLNSSAAEVQIDPVFRAYFDAHGGLPVLGLPLAPAETEGGRKVQYTERARMEYHPENAGTPYEVQLGLLGLEQTAGRLFDPRPAGANTAAANTRFFPETNHILSGAFLLYWNQYGGLAQFGFPISEEVQENGFTVQYFERNRFEFHPENQPPYNVLLGLLGKDSYNQRISIGDARVTLPTYNYERGFSGDSPTTYPKLDFAAVGAATPRTYKIITLENRFLKLALMPELGGRLYDVLYKPTGHSELYRNPVVKPAPFGARGWWLGVGGGEWAFPTDEHGFLEYLPWTASTRREERGGVTVTVVAADRVSGLIGTAEVTLLPEEAFYHVSFKVKNLTASPQRFQMWTNTMLAPGGGNSIPKNSRWTLPGTELIVHSTDDTALPAPQERISWPTFAGRNLSDYGTWTGYLGGFVPPDKRTGDFAGLYNLDANEGMVRVGPPANVAQGLKIFGFGPTFDPHIYTDDNSSYAELWGGLLPTFWDYTNLAPGKEAGWSETWQPVAGTGGIAYANDWGTLNARQTGNGVRIDLSPTEPFAGRLIVRSNGQEIARRNLELQPGVAFSHTTPGSGPVEVEITNASGARVLKTTVNN